LRCDRAILAISVITLAEARYGYLNANWGASRIEREERRLAGFLQLPLDLAVIDEYKRNPYARTKPCLPRNSGEETYAACAP
jgi:predicted nucleic acid-binding protein